MANFNIDYLVVAGGGGGSNELGGGGGAGGYLTNVGGTAEPLQDTIIYTVVIGDGGRGGVIGSARDTENTRGGDGGNSSLSGSNITTITSTGGGGGGALGPNVRYGRNGGSGGGAAAYDPGGIGTTVGLGNTPTTTPSQGNDGGYSYKSSGVYPGGGGGGAGAVGGNYSGSAGGNGGVGLQNDITVATAGTGPYYAGGGGGNGYGSSCGVGTAGVGGNGGGGNSGIGRDCSSANGYNGTDGLGGGGGAATYPPSTQYGGSGGSGIVILRYTTADIASYTTTGITPTEDTTTISGQTILSFTTVGTGTITFTTPIPPIPPFSGTRVTNPVTGFESPVDIGLKLPSGTNDNLPTAIQGMIRNDTSETTGSSASAIIHYNGTNWQYFAATESPDVVINPLILSSVMYYSASDTNSYPGSGTDWFDLSGNSNTATITSSNYSNGYFDLTPTASIITTPVNTLYQTFSYSIWVKFDSVTVASGYALSVLTKSQFYASNHQAFPFYAAVTTTGTFTNNLSYGNDYSPDVINSTSVSANTWYNIACVIDTTTNTSKLYIGTESTQLALVSSVNYTGTLVSNPNQFYSLGKAPAEYSSGVGKSSMNGKIAKFGFWDIALTEAELITIWGLGSGAS